MPRQDDERQSERPFGRPLSPVNLTEAAEPMSWSQACSLVGVGGPAGAPALEIRGLSHAENGHQNDGSVEAVYIVIAGFGALRFDDEVIECTAGDVLFVPRGRRYHFERMDGEIRMWKISPAVP
jgi:mannose-6-phosphate isomerase-like protein (cupin superfamily)